MSIIKKSVVVMVSLILPLSGCEMVLDGCGIFLNSFVPKAQREAEAQIEAEHLKRWIIIDGETRQYSEKRAALLAKILQEAELAGDYKFIEAYRTKQAYLGMSKSDVLFVKGEPSDHSTTVDASGTHDFWTYGSSSTYYFINDVLVSFDK